MTPLLASPLAVLRVRGGGGGGPGFGAPRSKVIDGKRVHYPHDGLDLACTHGESVLAPIGGAPVRVITCYRGDTYRGLELVTSWGLHVDLLYVLPFPSLLERQVALEPGEPIALAQAISRRYPGQEMEDHVHLRVWMRLTAPEPPELIDIETRQKAHSAYGYLIRCYDPAPLLGLT